MTTLVIDYRFNRREFSSICKAQLDQSALNYQHPAKHILYVSDLSQLEPVGDNPTTFFENEEHCSTFIDLIKNDARILILVKQAIQSHGDGGIRIQLNINIDSFFPDLDPAIKKYAGYSKTEGKYVWDELSWISLVLDFPLNLQKENDDSYFCTLQTIFPIDNEYVVDEKINNTNKAAIKGSIITSGLTKRFHFNLDEINLNADMMQPLICKKNTSFSPPENVFSRHRFYPGDRRSGLKGIQIEKAKSLLMLDTSLYNMIGAQNKLFTCRKIFVKRLSELKEKIQSKTDLDNELITLISTCFPGFQSAEIDLFPELNIDLNYINLERDLYEISPKLGALTQLVRDLELYTTLTQKSTTFYKSVENYTAHYLCKHFPDVSNEEVIEFVQQLMALTGEATLKLKGINFIIPAKNNKEINKRRKDFEKLLKDDKKIWRIKAICAHYIDNPELRDKNTYLKELLKLIKNVCDSYHEIQLILGELNNATCLGDSLFSLVDDVRRLRKRDITTTQVNLQKLRDNNISGVPSNEAAQHLLDHFEEEKESYEVTRLLDIGFNAHQLKLKESISQSLVQLMTTIIDRQNAGEMDFDITELSGYGLFFLHSEEDGYDIGNLAFSLPDLDYEKFCQGLCEIESLISSINQKIEGTELGDIFYPNIATLAQFIAEFDDMRRDYPYACNLQLGHNTETMLFEIIDGLQHRLVIEKKYTERLAAGKPTREPSPRTAEEGIRIADELFCDPDSPGYLGPMRLRYVPLASLKEQLSLIAGATLSSKKSMS